ncbi:MAG TPA: 4-alpha-glucanotransferase [Pyrinomonadaceae bacterium]|nr:4-alpha-glucanotransferase [Pyrinomonadaceae bacterium]
MQFPRASGVLLHPTSLPGEFGIGDLGSKAFAFVDFLVRTKQTYWQVLPLGPTGWGDSPYSSFSAFAGNTLLISPEKLRDDGLLLTDENPAFNTDRVDYGAVYEWKSKMLRTAFENWRGGEHSEEFVSFATENAPWLNDYSMYRAIKMSQNQKPWLEWPEPLKLRNDGALTEAANDLADNILAEKFYQFLFFKQWAAVKGYANSHGIKIIGDVPIFLALDSVDIWRHQGQFKLNPDGTPRVVSGVPPDFFSKTGQLWGNPIYDWDAMLADGFAWWKERIRFTRRTVDIVRIDHFRGFASAWEVPGGNPTAEHGEWVDAPGHELFASLKEEFGELPFWVEDLGFVTPEVEQLRDESDFPGMRILQFAFSDAYNGALPHNYIRNCVAYTGTHDNDTIVGWWKAQINEEGEASDAQRFAEKYLDTDGTDVHWHMIRAIWSSIADSAVVPLQDILGLDNSAIMNRPSTTSGNWQWRFKDGDLTDEIADRLTEMTEVYGRERRGE